MKRNSLQTAAVMPLLIVCALSLITLIVAGWVRYKSIPTAADHAAQYIGTTVRADYIIHTQAGPVIRDPEKLRSLLSEISDEPINVAITPARSSDPALFEYENIPSGDKSVIDSSNILGENGTAIGNISVSVSVEKNYNRLFRRFILMAFLIIAVTLYGCRKIARRYQALNNSVDEMLNAIASFERSDIPKRVEASGPMEISDLQNGINTLTDQFNNLKENLSQQMLATTHELNETLEEVEIKNVELDLARKRAVESNEAKSTFLANISHEIRSPMNGIIGHLQLLQQLPATGQQKIYINNSLMAANDLLDIIDDTLNLSRIEANRLDIQNQPFDLLEEINRCVVMLAPAAIEKKLDVYFLSFPQLPRIFYGDSLRLRQVMTNLISNAIKYTDSGSVRLCVSTFAVADNRYEIQLDVADTGLGMTSTQIDSLFEAYSQAGRSPESGTGLGLLITRSLTEAMGGKLELVSEVDRGSVFTVRLTLTGADNDSTKDDIKLSGRGFVDCEDDEARTILEQILIDTGISLTERDKGDADCWIKVLTQSAIEDFTRQNIDIPSLCSQFECRHLVLASTDDPSLINRLNLNPNCVAIPLHSHMYAVKAALRRLLGNVIPASDEPESASETATMPSSGINTHTSFDGCRILLADDDNFGRAYMADLLGQQGIDVHTCVNGEEAVNLAKASPYDLILMDLRMPVCDGVEATRRIRALPIARHTPIIGMTASVIPEQHQQCVAAGMTDYWVKPLQIGQLLSGLGHWLESGLERTGELPLQKNIGQIMTELDADMRDLLIAELKSFKSCCDTDINDLNIDTLRQAAHRISGSAAICNLDALKSAAQKIDNPDLASDSPELPDFLAAVKLEIENILDLVPQHAAAS